MKYLALFVRARFGPLAAVLAAGVLLAVAATTAQAQRTFDPERAYQWPDTDFTKKSVPFDEIFSGGVPKDGIPAIDDPVYGSIADAAKHFGDTEPMFSVSINGEARAYPLGVLMRHEIANDVLGGVPIAVTFCPLCNSTIVFERTVNGQVLDFGTTGNLRFSDLVMYDRQTQSWWQQFVGEAIIGEMTGTLLKMVPAKVESFAKFKEEYPSGTVLMGSEKRGGFNPAYLSNPYAGYDQAPRPFLYSGESPKDIAPLAYVVAVGKQAWSLDVLRKQKRIETDNLVITWEPGQNSAMNSRVISQGTDIGNVEVFKKEGGKLVPALHDVTFAFAFNAFNPDGTLYLDWVPRDLKGKLGYYWSRPDTRWPMIGGAALIVVVLFGIVGFAVMRRRGKASA